MSIPGRAAGVSDSLVDFTKQWAVDLLIIGSRGMGTFKRWGERDGEQLALSSLPWFNMRSYMLTPRPRCPQLLAHLCGLPSAHRAFCQRCSRTQPAEACKLPPLPPCPCATDSHPHRAPLLLHAPQVDDEPRGARQRVRRRAAQRAVPGAPGQVRTGRWVFRAAGRAASRS